MIILLLALAVIAAYAWLLHVATTADRKAQGHTHVVSATTAQTSVRAGDDLIHANIEGATWTVLDDHQLYRLLKESAPTNRPDHLQ